MATNIVTDRTDGASSDATLPLPSRGKYTPDDHEKASALKVVRLVGLGANENGKTATFEFDGGFVRSIDVDAQTVWHSIFRPITDSDWRRLLDHVAIRTRAADGTIIVQDGPMWFWTQRSTPRGRHLESRYFDVPKENYSTGRLTGTKAARDLILFLKRYERARTESFGYGSIAHKIESCLEEAFSLSNSRVSYKEPSSANAAVTFCQTVTRYFCVGVKSANPDYLEGLIRRDEDALAWSVEYDKRSDQETAERMRAVRAAKATKRKGQPAPLNTTVEQQASATVH